MALPVPHTFPLFDLFDAVQRRYGGYYAAVGNFTAGFVHDLRYQDYDLLELDIPACMRVLRAIGRGSRELLRIASSIRAEKLPVAPTLRQSALTEFYSISKRGTTKGDKGSRKTPPCVKGLKTIALDKIFAVEPAGVSGARSWCLIVTTQTPPSDISPPTSLQTHPHSQLRIVG